MSASDHSSSHRTLRTRGLAPAPDAAEPLSLDSAVAHLLDECRLVLPGIQALFGFQLIAVFSGDFAERLGAGEQRLHLAAIGLVALAVGLVMTPAAIHRQIHPRVVTERFLRTSSRLLVAGMIPLAVAIAAEVYLVARLVLGSPMIAAVIGAAALATFLLLWFVLPRSRLAS